MKLFFHLILSGLIMIISTGCNNKGAPEIMNKANKTQLKNREKATFAGGCFWCMEAAFENLEGVIDVISGYTGGETKNPTYEQVSSGTSGNLEAIQITYGCIPI